MISPYWKGGVEALVEKNVVSNRATLTLAEIEGLSKRLRLYTPADLLGAMAATLAGQSWTPPDLKPAVHKWYDASYQSNSSYYQLLALCGFSYQRTARVHKSRSMTKIAEFEEQCEKKPVNIAQDATETVIFAED